MYTFSPLANINTVDDHGFFYFFSFGLICFLVATLISCRDDREGALWTTLITIGLIGVAALLSWNTGKIKDYENKQVTGEFVNFVAEGYNITEHYGKTTRHVDKHFTYVVYSVEGNNVMMQAEPGRTYPQTAVLYKN